MAEWNPFKDLVTLRKKIIGLLKVSASDKIHCVKYRGADTGVDPKSLDISVTHNRLDYGRGKTLIVGGTSRSVS